MKPALPARVARHLRHPRAFHATRRAYVHTSYRNVNRCEQERCNHRGSSLHARVHALDAKLAGRRRSSSDAASEKPAKGWSLDPFQWLAMVRKLVCSVLTRFYCLALRCYSRVYARAWRRSRLLAPARSPPPSGMPRRISQTGLPAKRRLTSCRVTNSSLRRACGLRFRVSPFFALVGLARHVAARWLATGGTRIIVTAFDSASYRILVERIVIATRRAFVT